jgi:hypothetical protein
MTSPFRWVLTAFRDLGLNVFGFLLMFAGAALLGVGVRTGMETLVERGHLWLALVFVVVAAGVWATLFGLVRKRHLRNPEGKILPLSAAGFLLGAAAVWVYVFAGLSYALMRLGFVEYALPPRPDDLLAHLTDAYSWHFLDLLPGVGINGALGWQCPVDLEGGRRGALLVLFRVAVLYQIFAKGRELLKRDESSGAPEANS